MLKVARPPRIELGSQASEAYVISIGPRAQQKLLYTTYTRNAINESHSKIGICFDNAETSLC